MKPILFATGALALLATEAHAQRNHRESERSTYFELRFGLYRPDIDSEFRPSPDPRQKRPFEAAFGDDRNVLPQFLYERQFFQRFGTMSAGLGVGYWNIEGSGQTTTEDSAASDTTEMVVVPLLAQVTYRFDYFENVVPLVPVVRGGIDYLLWEVLDGSGERARFASGNEAAGGTWGWHYTLGLHLLLDFFAPEMADDFDRDAGVNGSYITFEYQVSKVDDFGSADSFRLGDKTFFFGIALDM